MGLFDKIMRSGDAVSEENSMVRHLSDKELDDLLKESDVPIVIDFWAPWCAPCRLIAPALEKIAKEFDGRAIVGKINVDKNKSWATKLGIRGIPAVSFFSKGKQVTQLVGVRQEKELRKTLEGILNSK